MDLFRKSKWENFILILIAVVTVGLMVASVRFERVVGNQKLLFYQLQAIRTSVNLFKALNKRNPQNLLELVTKEYTFEGEQESHRYLEAPPLDENGNMRDPFENPYSYVEKTGWIRSSTPGYEYW